MDADENDDISLPPEDATNAQLLVLVMQLKRDIRFMRQEQRETRKKVDEMAQAFGTAKSVTSGIKWLAAFGAACAAIFGLLKVT